MTDLSREQIERIRNEYDHEGLEEVCDMALAKKDAEAERDQANRDCCYAVSAMERAEAVRDAAKENKEKCPSCKGSGWEITGDIGVMSRCPRCEGTGGWDND